MQRIENDTIKNLFVVYVDDVTIFYVKEDFETLHDFVMQIFFAYKTQNTKSLSVYPYGNPEAYPVLEYEDDGEDGITFWAAD